MSYPVTVQLICAFVFAYAKIRFSHDAAHILKWYFNRLVKEKDSIKVYQRKQHKISNQNCPSFWSK